MLKAISNRMLLWLITVLMVTTAKGQPTPEPYFTIDQLADAALFLPEPPDTASAQFAYDVSQYYWGVSVRNTDRGQQAKYDAQGVYTVLCENFSDAFGMDISPEGTPDIYKVVANSLKTTSNACSKCKTHYFRERPYQYFKEESMFTGETLGQTSYPSSHSAKGWMLGLLLGEINPSAQVELLVRGYEYGQSRVIVGAHWQSDVDAGRMVGSATFSRMHSDSTFTADLCAAKAEFKRIIGNDAVQDLNTEISVGETNQWYTIDGKRADDDTRGIVIGRGRKVLRTGY